MSNLDRSRLQPRENRRKPKYDLSNLARGLQRIGVPETIGISGTICRPDASVTDTPEKFVLDYLAEHIFKKWKLKQPGIDLKAAARQRFDEAELLCKETNQRFSPLYRHHGGFQTVIHTARVLLEDLLGSYRGRSDAELRQVLLVATSSHYNFGPGASTRLKKRVGDKAYKYSGQPEVTSKCAPLAESIIGLSPIWKQIAEKNGTLVHKVQGSHIVTVPKNYKTHRTIAIEPDMNMYIQKGLGGYIRKRLKRFGIDLDDQSINQRLALIGSSDGSLATIDLSMASDTVSRRLCQSILPPHIADFIEETRCDYGIHSDGTVTYYQKVSSMGNGFTFELESAIFWALSKAVIITEDIPDTRLSVYGDDIIVPTAAVDRLFEVLNYCGFSINKEKSFWAGGFRESCGKHYMNGLDVTPFYVKEPPRTTKKLMLLHNQLWRWRDRVACMLNQDQWDILTDILSDIEDHVPASYRKLRIPDGFGDGGFTTYVGDLIVRKNGRKYRHFDVVQLPAFSEVTNHNYCDLPGMMIKSLLRLETNCPNKTGFPLADFVNQQLNVIDRLEILPSSAVKRVTFGSLKIPISVFKGLQDSYSYFTFQTNNLTQ